MQFCTCLILSFDLSTKLCFNLKDNLNFKYYIRRVLIIELEKRNIYNSIFGELIEKTKKIEVTENITIALNESKSLKETLEQLLI